MVIGVQLGNPTAPLANKAAVGQQNDIETIPVFMNTEVFALIGAIRVDSNLKASTLLLGLASL